MKKINHWFKKQPIIINLLIIFFILIFLYLAFLTFSYMIPGDLIQEHWQQSVHTIHSETTRWAVMTNYDGTMLDTFTDNYMFQKMTNDAELHPLKAALSNNGYVRYWFGIIGILRPLLVFVDYTSIRYFNIFLIFGLMSIVVVKLKNVLGWRFSLSFLLTMGMIHFWIFPLSLQYSPVYVIFVVSIIYFIQLYEKDHLNNKLVIISFFFIGSLTNYFDLLTAPLLTFGFPFIVWFVLANTKQNLGIKTNYLVSLFNGVSWLAGYGMTWFAKWVIGDLVLEQDVIINAFNQVGVRTQGDPETIAPLSEIMERLLEVAFPKEFIVILVIWLFVWAVLMVKERRTFSKRLMEHLPLIGVALLPFLWVAVLQNHNQSHSYFTYRIFAITVFAMMSFLMSLPKKVNQRVKE